MLFRSFAVDALTESVREGGYLVEPDDYAAFAAQIDAYFALDREDREAVRQSCRAYVRANYTWDAAADQYMHVFEGRSPHAH